MNLEIHPDDLNIVSLRHCYTFYTHLQKGLDRLLQGPIDSCGEGKIQPIDIISYNENYFLLEHEPPDKPSYIVGYIYIQRYIAENHKYIHLLEFEIFQEYRGNQFGKHFLQKMQDLEVFQEDIDADIIYSGVYPICLSACGFYYIWQNCRDMFLDRFQGEFPNIIESIESIQYNTTNVEIEQLIHKHVSARTHTKLVEMLIEQILFYMIQKEDWTPELVSKYVESLREWKAIVMQFEKSQCIVCNSHCMYLWTTSCGHKEHVLCDRCMTIIEDRCESCPYKCTTKPIYRQTRINRMKNEDECLVWAIA